MKLDRKIIRVVVLPCNVESICPKCALRHLASCNSDIYDIENSLREDSPIKECYETGIKRVVTQCDGFRAKPAQLTRVNPDFTWEYILNNGKRTLTKVYKNKNK